ncbi:methylated-DNA--[protein]-cysteine S-methyltransferase [Elioraea sp.]|uniref:methylated-DNA--[protein]-cysteine S-methyltransferase n=1 Tax=Elioraea sp. TaxID=2185103 RepID=UPI00307E97AC
MPQLTALTPLGELTLSEEDGAIVALDWGRGRDQTATLLLRRAVVALHAYFDGAAEPFADLPLNPAGTAFQRRVWTAMRAIPRGRTRSYGALARDLRSSARAVGAACGANPIPVIIPCHRVTGARGLGGYSGGDGAATKRYLLGLEQA